MSEAGEDWAKWSVAAAEDAVLASFAAGGALLLWDPAAEKPHFVNAAAVHRRPVAVNRPVVMHPHRDNGRHGGWEDHRRGPNRHDTNNYYRR